MLNFYFELVVKYVPLLSLSYLLLLFDKHSSAKSSLVRSLNFGVIIGLLCGLIWLHRDGVNHDPDN